MELNWLESILFGFLTGLTDILPVSSQAHKLLLLKLFGVSSEPNLLRLFLHIGILAALYFSCASHIVRFARAKRLARVPKRRRKRPLDTKSLMDYSLLKTMIIPVILSLFVYEKAASLKTNLILVACFLLLNGIILYVPQFMPGSNKDSRMLSRVEGFLMGLGGALGVLPGISSVGAATSVGSVCGVERNYGLTMSLLLNMFLTVGLIVLDVMAIVSGNAGYLTFQIVLCYIVSAAAAFGGTLVGISALQNLAANSGFTPFAFYCWGLALFTFILNLMA